MLHGHNNFLAITMFPGCNQLSSSKSFSSWAFLCHDIYVSIQLDIEIIFLLISFNNQLHQKLLGWLACCILTSSTNSQCLSMGKKGRLLNTDSQSRYILLSGQGYSQILDSGMRTVYFCRLNKVFNSTFPEGYLGQQVT